MNEFLAYIKLVAHSSTFKGIIMVVILLNTVTFAVSISMEDTKDNKILLIFLDSVDTCFLTAYCLEFIIKLYALRLGYFLNGFNCFDFGVLLCSLLQFILSSAGAQFGVIKVMRSLRALRVLRSISLVGGLQVIVTALIATFTGSFIHIILLLMLMMFVYGVLAFYMFGYDSGETGSEYWGTFGKSYLSLFILVTADGWSDVHRSLVAISNSFGSYFFIISFIFVGHFIFLNLFVAVIIEQIQRATEGYQMRLGLKQDDVVLKRKQKVEGEIEDDIAEIMKKVKTRGGGHQFPRVVLNMYKHMRSDEFVMCSHVTSLSQSWVSNFNYEYTQLTASSRALRSFHLETVGSLGEMISDMDMDVQEALVEQAARETCIFTNEPRKASFFRRLSRRATLFSQVRKGLASESGEGGSEQTEEEVQVCVSCVSVLPKCYCVKTETESRANDELAQGPAIPWQRLLSLSVAGSKHRRSSVVPHLPVVTEEVPADR